MLDADARPAEISLGDELLLQHPITDFASARQTLEHCSNNSGGGVHASSTSTSSSSGGSGGGSVGLGQLVSSLRPLRVPLRVKRSVRCKESLTIVIHPHVNPQQGDSNFGRNESARWFEMDEFASEYMPRIVMHRVTSQV